MTEETGRKILEGREMEGKGGREVKMGRKACFPPLKPVNNLRCKTMLLLKPIDSSHKVPFSFSLFILPFPPSSPSDWYPIYSPLYYPFRTIGLPLLFLVYNFLTFLIRSFHFSPLVYSSATVPFNLSPFSLIFLILSYTSPSLSSLRYSVPHASLSPSNFPSIPTHCKASLRVCLNER